VLAAALIGAAGGALGRAQASAAPGLLLSTPFARGAGADLQARLLGRLMGAALGREVAVANRPGAQGVANAARLAAAEPDGRTLGLVTADLVATWHAGLTEVSWREFTPVGLLSLAPAAVVVPAGSPWHSFAQLLDAVRRSPGRHRITGGARSGVWHAAFAGALRVCGLDPAEAPWIGHGGASRALQDLVAGTADAACCALADAGQLIDSGQLRALTVMSERRDEKYRDLPTLGEATGRDWSAGSFLALVGPPGLAAELAAPAAAAAAEATGSRDWRDFLVSRGLQPAFADASGLAAHLERVDGELGPILRQLAPGVPRASAREPIQR
jgi:tripartite-type tricarboxylate transporter receptor subunit TctC